MLKDQLIEFGLATTQADIYILVAKTSNITAGEIIKNLNINRVLVYRALESLVAQNLISESKIKNVKTYTINDPIYFKSKVDNQMVLASKIEEQIKNINESPDQNSQVSLYKGQEAILNFINLVLETKQTWYVIGAIFGMTQVEFKDHIAYFEKAFLKSKIQTKVIAKFGSQDLSWTPKELTEIRTLPEDFTNSPIVVHIFGDYVCHTIWEKPETVIVIKNQAIALEYQKYFEILWQKAN
jgi:sugar-specific transcriptional regulator TrmB